MHIITQIEEFHSDDLPIALTIGNFDGIHLGHQAVLKQIQKKGLPVVLTFSNHPSEVLSSNAHKNRLLMTLPHKLALLRSLGIETTALLPFTKAFSQLSARDFLRYLKRAIPFSFLILGHDATIGYQRSGNRDLLHQLAKELDFQLEYLPPIELNSQPVSSSLIRESIQKGDFEKASQFLGRAYSIIAPVEQGAGKGKTIGYQTANLKVDTLCLPPLGVYAVEVLHKNCRFPGVANLGFAPTLHQNPTPRLEVHILDHTQDLYHEEIEVIFRAFLREEKKFETVEALKHQISEDILKAKAHFLAVLNR